MTADQIAARIARIGDIPAALASAAPDDRARLYGQLGLTMIYDPGASTVEVNVRPLPDMYVRKCPRGDLNTNPREISPDRGFHADNATPVRLTASPVADMVTATESTMIEFYAGCLQSAPMRSPVFPSAFGTLVWQSSSEPGPSYGNRRWPLDVTDRAAQASHG